MPQPAAHIFPRLAAPLRNMVTTTIAEEIADGTYRPGERLVERDLCERYGVSRTVIREALRHLEAQQLVEIVPNRGPVVATITPEDARCLYEVRASLEALAAARFTERATLEERHKIADAFEVVVANSDPNAMGALLSAKDGFYEVMFEGAHNPLIATMLRSIYLRTRLLRSFSLSSPGRIKNTLAELRELLEAFDRGDVETASNLARRHVEKAAILATARLAEIQQTESAEKTG